jgi:hypothetical protein
VESARPADPSDVARIVELADALRGELEEQRGGTLWLRAGTPRR